MIGRTKRVEAQLEHVVEEARKLQATKGFRWGLVVGSVITVAIGFFIFQNGEQTSLEFLWFEFESALWVGLLLSFLAGSVCGPLFWRAWQRHRVQAREQRDAERAIRKAARNLPEETDADS